MQLKPKDDKHYPYAGDVTAVQCWEMLKSDKEAVLVDVRTKAEWNYVGFPDLSKISNSSLYISWRLYPFMQVNPDFNSELETQLTNKHSPVFFICKSGGRSREAAIEMTSRGFEHCYNVADGFEGILSSAGESAVNGWKNILPWKHI
ncbi:MAG: rhodanese-like domain-containing protein [Proteobacteria bacterium]|nr:rhodanese-like domain-containing protein [Pseudomonadota bacterium]